MQRPELVPCCAQAQLERGCARRRIRWDRAQRRRPETSTPHMRTVRRSATFKGEAKIAILRRSARCHTKSSRLRIFSYSMPGVPGQQLSAQAVSEDMAIGVCVSAGNRIFRFLADPSGERRNLEKCSEEVRSGSGCVLRPIRMYINRSGALDRTSPFLL